MALFPSPCWWNFQCNRFHRLTWLWGKSPCTEFTEACAVTDSVSLRLMNQIRDKNVYRMWRRKIGKETLWRELLPCSDCYCPTPLPQAWREQASAGLWQAGCRVLLLEGPHGAADCAAVQQSWSKGTGWGEGCPAGNAYPRKVGWTKGSLNVYWWPRAKLLAWGWPKSWPEGPSSKNQWVTTEFIKKELQETDWYEKMRVPAPREL